MKRYIGFLILVLIISQSCFSSSQDLLFPIKIGEKYGYINYDGELKIEPIYEKAKEFSEGLASVKLEDGYAYIDNSGEVVFELDVDFAGPFSEGKAEILKNRLLGYIDKKGQIVIPPIYKHAKSFNEGFAQVELDNGYFYIDHKGENIFDKTFERCDSFNDGYAIVMDLVKNSDGSSKRVSYIINTDGDIILDPSDFRILGDQVCNGLIRGKQDTNRGFIDIEGNLVINLKNNYPSDFSENYSVVEDVSSNKYGLIDLDGQWVISPKYEELTDMSEGLIPFAKDDLWGFIDINEDIVIPNSFLSVLPFVNGMAIVNPRDGYDGGYVNKEGHVFLGKDYIDQ